MSIVSPRAFIDCIADAPRVHDAAAAGRLRETLGARAEAWPPAARALIEAVGGGSPFLSALIARAPDDLDALFARPPAESLAAAIAEADAAGDAEDAPAQMRALRLAKRRAALLAGLAETGGVWSSLEAGAALSDFADACVGAALRASLRSLASKGFAGAERARCEENSGVAIIAMGKLGGRELNFSSDIDLIVLYDAEAQALGDPLAARAIALAATRQLVRLLSEQTGDGYVFRADLRLRPDPGVSAAAVSARAAEAYYEAHGQNWERAAFIRARACAGDLAVGEAFLERLRPFVWRKYLDFAAIEDIHSIMRQIYAAKGGEAITFLGHDIKTGSGGIREIEFLIQTQQLILGGRNPALRRRATLDALAALADAGKIAADAAASVEAAYSYLRRVEHRLQMIADEQTHRIPRDKTEAARLAALLGEESLAAFEARLTAVLRDTHERFGALFGQEERLSSEAGSLVFTGVENDAATLETLSRLGFARPADVSDTIRRWHMGSVRATRSPRARELLTKLGPRLIEALARASDPDAAFVAFDRFLGLLPAGVQVFSLFARNPEIFDILIRIMTIAPFLGRELSRRRHLIEAALENGWPGPLPDPATLEGELRARLARAGAYEDALNEARRWGAERNFETAARLVLDVIGPAEAARHFTAAADAAIRALLSEAEREMARQHGAIDGALAILGLGRLGAGAMTARSDIDLVFVYEAPDGAVSDGVKPLDAATYYIRLVRRFLAALSATTEEGALYEVDMQLRPSGAKGPWAVSLAAFERYYRADAWTWEEMALLKARVVAGAPDFAARISQAIDAIIARPRGRARLAADVCDMRQRLAEAKPASGPWDLKNLEGGLTDLDFVLAFVALAQGARIGRPPPDQQAMTRFLLEKGAIASEDALALLTASELFESVMQLARAAAGDALGREPASAKPGAALEARLAAACGAATAEDAEAVLAARRKAMRRLYDRLVTAAAKDVAPDTARPADDETKPTV